MNILRVTRQFYPAVGGVENVALGLSRALLPLGCVSRVVTLNRVFASGQRLPPVDEVFGVPVRRIPFWGSRRYPLAPGVLAEAHWADVIHIHAIDFFVDALSLTRGWHRRPMVVTTHGGIFHTRWLWPLKRLWFATQTRLALRGVTAVVCDSAHDYALFRAIVPEEKLRLIHNGVDIQAFSALRKSIVPGQLLGIGRLAPNKGVERLVKLLPQLAAEFPAVRLVWVGEDVENRIPALMTLAERLRVADRVQFLGRLSHAELGEQLTRAHLFVSPSLYEAFGVATIEAMSSGTVPVVTPVGVHPEVICDGENGFLCSYEAEAALSCFRRAFALSDEQLRQMGEQARIAARPLAWDNVAHAYQQVYESVLTELRDG